MDLNTLKEKQFFLRSDFPDGFADNIRDIDRWSLLSDRFDAFNALTASSDVGCIPRLIHQIWLGGPLPEAYRPLSESWKRFNPGWEYRLWDERAILDFGLVNERAFRLSPSYGVKSDIARYEILERLGGIYADTDFECIRPFDKLADRATFVAGTIFNTSPEIANGLIGSIPGHPLLARLIAGLAEPIASMDGMDILDQSGPRYLTQCFFEMTLLSKKSDVVLPSGYFYPFPNFAKAESTFSETRDRYAKEWSLAIHYWEASWLRPSPLHAFLGRVKRKARTLIGL